MFVPKAERRGPEDRRTHRPAPFLALPLLIVACSPAAVQPTRCPQRRAEPGSFGGTPHGVPTPWDDATFTGELICSPT